MFGRGWFWWILAVLSLGGACGGEENARPDPAPSARSWTAPEVLDESRIAYWVKAAHDARGNALVVWDDLNGKVNAKRYDVRSETWGASKLLDPDNPDDSAVPSLAFDGQGNAIACWQRQSQQDDMRSVWTSRYDAASDSWGPAEQIENSELVLAPQLAMDGAGNALLAFTRAEIGAPIMAARFDVERRRWSAAEPLVAAKGLARAPKVALAPGGSGVAIWIDGDLDQTAVWAARYDGKSKSWSKARVIAEEAEMAVPSDVTILSNGEAVAVWTQMSEERNELWVSRSAAPEGAWSDPQRLNVDGKGDPVSARILFDDSGNGLAVWSAHDGERGSVWANRYDGERGRWTGAEPLDAGPYDALPPSVASDEAGNILVLWARKDETNSSPWTRSYTAATNSWSAPAALDDEAQGQAEFVELSLTRDGRALAVWSRDGSSIVASQLR